MKISKVKTQPTGFRAIPTSSLILPHLLEFEVPDFTQYSKKKGYVLSFKDTSVKDWFYEFVELINKKIEGSEYFPVMRFSDGEYNFLVGLHFPLYTGHTLTEYLRLLLSGIKQKFFKKTFSAATAKNVSSGFYTREEIKKQKQHSVNCLRRIADKGVMALHLNYSQKPFQENYHKPFKDWLEKNRISFSEDNYYPFYFVYALLRGAERKKIFSGRNVLVVHSATGDKREAIKLSLLDEGVKSVSWCEISSSRSMYDTLDLEPYENIDFALIGAGVGKFNILAQLEELSVPCIDAGFIFEVWANDDKKHERTMMIPDSERLTDND